MQPHVERMVVEYAELSEKLEKLKSFFDTAMFGGQLEFDRQLMFAQFDAMCSYQTILRNRIVRAHPEFEAD